MPRTTTTPPTTPTPTPTLKAMFFTASLGGGGAEMHLARLLASFDRGVVTPALALARGGGSYLARLPADVATTSWFAARRSSTLSLAAAIPLLARHIAAERPDVVMSFLEMPNLALLAAARLVPRRPLVVLGTQIAPIEAYRHGALGRAILAGIRHVYRHADAIVALSAGVRGELIALDARLADRTHVIANAIVDDHARAARTRPARRPDGVTDLLVACGRLVPQKNFPLLLRALARVRRRRAAHLWLLGDGPDRAALEAQAQALDLGAHVSFLGWKDDPGSFFAAADVFVMSSDFEGFGNVLVEAMVGGTPVVSTDCPHGPGEIIASGQSGLLVPTGDETALADAVLAVLEDGALAARLRAGGARRAEDFAAARIAAEHARLFASLATKARRAR